MSPHLHAPAELAQEQGVHWESQPGIGVFRCRSPVFRALRKHQSHTACMGSQPQHHSHGVLSCLQTGANSQTHGINKDTVPHVTPRTDFATFVQSLGTNRATPPAQSVTCHEHSSFWAHFVPESSKQSCFVRLFFRQTLSLWPDTHLTLM